MAAYASPSAGGGGLPIEVQMIPNPAVLVAQMEATAVDIRSYREPLTRAIRKVMQPSFQKNFEVGGRPQWPPLAESTAVTKAELGYPKDTLVRTKALKRASQYLSIWTITREDAYIESLPHYVFYGVYHQAGSPATNLPQREFLNVQDEDLDAIEGVFIEWIGERLLRHGWRPGISETLSVL